MLVILLATRAKTPISEKEAAFHMYTCKYPNLFKPLKLGNTILRNRIFAAPTGYCDLTRENIATEPLMAYYEAKARGGAAVVHVGEAYIDSKHGVDIPKYLALDTDECVSPLATVADAISKHGAVPSIELMHAGMFASQSYVEGNEIWAPSETPVSGTKAGERLHGAVIPEMPEEVIYQIIEQYAEAARRVQKAGFRMVLLHGGHGWLLNQFLSPLVNHRTDKWGGSPENRARFAVMVCDRIKEVCGKNFLIDFRISADEVNSVGYHIDTGIEIAKAIDGHCDIIHCSCGNHEVIESFVVMHPSMFLPDGVNMRFAAEIKKHVKTPVATVGAFSDPAMMDKVLADGTVDVIEIARGLIADPDLPNKARAGKDCDINECLRCYTCFSQLITTGQYGCAINPIIGRELENKYDIPPARKCKVVVIGGGIGGMEATLDCAKRGHKVILLEKADRLGGVLLIEDEVSFKSKLKQYLARQAARVMDNPDIEVRLNTEATAAPLSPLEPDAVIAALGSRPAVPTYLEGWDGRNVMSAEYAYTHLGEVGGSAVVIGGGLVGAELAIHLAENGRKVTLMHRHSEVKCGANGLHGQAIGEQIHILKIGTAMNTSPTKITDKGVYGKGPEGEKLYEADTVIYAVGQRPLADEAEQFRFCAPDFYIVGDCGTPATIYQATSQAYYAARDIGRI